MRLQPRVLDVSVVRLDHLPRTPSQEGLRLPPGTETLRLEGPELPRRPTFPPQLLPLHMRPCRTGDRERECFPTPTVLLELHLPLVPFRRQTSLFSPDTPVAGVDGPSALTPPPSSRSRPHLGPGVVPGVPSLTTRSRRTVEEWRRRVGTTGRGYGVSGSRVVSQEPNLRGRSPSTQLVTQIPRG